VKKWWKRHFSVTVLDGPSDDGLAALQMRAGQFTAWYDQRGVIDANPPEQPQAGYADAHLRMVDPNWRPM
jgi:hypothetical protein